MILISVLGVSAQTFVPASAQARTSPEAVQFGPVPDPYETAEPDPYETAEPAPITIGDLAISGTVGVAVTGQLAASGAAAGQAFAYSVVNTADLPAGVSISASGLISGSPAAAGTHQVKVRGCAGAACATAQVTFTITAPAWTFTAQSVSGTVGVALNFALSVQGVSAGQAVTYAHGAGLPAGLVLAADGTLSGTPVAAGVVTVPVQACAGTQCQTATLTVTVVAAGEEPDPGATGEPVEPYTPSFVVGGIAVQVGVQYTGSLTVTGAPQGAEVTYTVADQSLVPAGLTIAADGTVSGVTTQAGVFAVPVKVCAGTACATVTVTITVAAGAESATAPIRLVVGGAVPTGTLFIPGWPRVRVTYTVVDASALPPGLTIGVNGRIIGRPTAVGTYTVQVHAQSGKGSTVVSLVFDVCPRAVRPCKSVCPRTRW